MKSFIISLALILSTQLINAQSEIAYQVGDKVIAPGMEYIGLKKNTDHSEEQSRLAMQTLRNHLLENIEYPEIMLQYSFEGSGLVEVKVSESGMIAEIRIIKSISPLFDQAIMDAMESLEYVSAKGQKYEGRRKMQLPVIFSIR